jgi:hypothetical protein
LINCIRVSSHDNVLYILHRLAVQSRNSHLCRGENSEENNGRGPSILEQLEHPRQMVITLIVYHGDGRLTHSIDALPSPTPNFVSD